MSSQETNRTLVIWGEFFIFLEANINFARENYALKSLSKTDNSNAYRLSFLSYEFLF